MEGELVLAWPWCPCFYPMGGLDMYCKFNSSILLLRVNTDVFSFEIFQGIMSVFFVVLYRQQPGMQPHTPPPPQQRGGRSSGGGSSSGGRRSGSDSGRGRSRYNPYWSINSHLPQACNDSAFSWSVDWHSTDYLSLKRLYVHICDGFLWEKYQGRNEYWDMYY